MSGWEPGTSWRCAWSLRKSLALKGLASRHLIDPMAKTDDAIGESSVTTMSTSVLLVRVQ